MSTRALRILLLCLAALVALPATAATAATYPKVKRIAPMQASVGQTLTITGSGFRPGRGKTTVVFKRDGQPAVFVKATTATRTKLKVLLPAKLDRFLAPAPIRFRVRILARRFGKRFTPLGASPRIARAATPAAPMTPATVPGPAPQAPTAPADCDADGTPDAIDAHDDADQLPDTLEAALLTDRCLSDTDGDGMQDGWEYRSAADLNQASCRPFEYPTPCPSATPYPTKKRYPNPLDPSDASIDFDGDSIPAGFEHQAWLRRADRNLQSLWYSDGMQASQDDPADPFDGCRGMRVPPALGGLFPLTPAQEQAYGLDLNRNGCLGDLERDEDGDHLGNYVELRGPLSAPSWWAKEYDEPAFALPYEGTNWLDADTDGDTIGDAFDDQDFDDFWNVEELGRGRPTVADREDDPTTDIDEAEDQTGLDTGDDSGLWVNPFNPCLPAPAARTCPDFYEFDQDLPMPFAGREAKTEQRFPKPRWPLYGAWLYAFPNRYAPTMTPAQQALVPRSAREQWTGMADADQQLPPAHPLLR
jgi:hypothetical protein